MNYRQISAVMLATVTTVGLESREARAQAPARQQPPVATTPLGTGVAAEPSPSVPTWVGPSGIGRGQARRTAYYVSPQPQGPAPIAGESRAVAPWPIAQASP